MNLQTSSNGHNAIVSPSVHSANYDTAVNDHVWFEHIADVSQNLLESYLKEIRKYPALKHEQVAELSKKAQSGDIKARDTIVKHNLRLVVFWARKFGARIGRDCAINLLDLIQEGNFGLVRAIETWDPNQSKFSTYATWWIRNKIGRAFDDFGGVIRRPVHTCDDIKKYVKISTKLCHAFLREPMDREIAEAMGLSVERVIELKELRKQNITSLDTPVHGGEDGDKRTLSDVISGYENEGPRKIQDDVVKKVVMESLRKLCSPKELEVLIGRFGLDENNPEPMTLEAIGNNLGVSRERIRQIEAKALEKIALLPNFVRVGLAIGLRIRPEVVKEAKERQKMAQEKKKAEIMAELETLYQQQKPKSVVNNLSSLPFI